MNLRIPASILLAIALAFVCAFAMSAQTDTARRLNLVWPEHWEYRPAVERNSVTYLQARQHRDGRTLQELSIAIVDTRRAKQDVTPEAVRDLALKLKNAALATIREDALDLIPLERRDGYYFAASRKAARSDSVPFVQFVEGVILHAGYLISFNLNTNDVDSPGTREILAALDRIEID